jgi:signal transduction histidine kinase
LLSLAVHELRTPVTVVSGYLRMLLKDRAGPLSDMQRRLLEEAEKSCGRLSVLLGEMSEIGQLEDGRQPLARAPVDLSDLLCQVVARAEPQADAARVVLQGNGVALRVEGDPSRLLRAMEAVVLSLRREIIDNSDLVVGRRARRGGRRPVAWIAAGTPPVTAALLEASAEDLGPFDEWRGGCGLSLPLARRVIELHGGRLLALPGERQKAGGVIELPLDAEASG